MKLSCTKENLWQGLAITSRISTKNVNLPILENVLLRTEGGGLKLISTNLEIAITCTIRGRVEQEGEYTVPSRLFYDFVNLLPNERIDVDLLDNSLLVACKNTKTKLNGIPSSEFPLVPPVIGEQVYSISVQEFKEGLGRVLFAAATNESRPELAGVLFSFHGEPAGSGKCVLAATDSYRLSETILTVSGGSSVEKKVIIPQRTLSELHRILGVFKDDVEAPPSIEIGLSENQVVFRYGVVELTSRMIDGSYPDYRQIIPSAVNTTIEVGRTEMIQAIKSTSLFSKQGLYDIKLSSKGAEGLEIRSNNTTRGENTVLLAASVTGQDSDIVLNYRYVLDGLNALTAEKIFIKIIDGANPCIIEPAGMPDEKFQYIVMPIRQ